MERSTNLILIAIITLMLAFAGCGGGGGGGDEATGESGKKYTLTASVVGGNGSVAPTSGTYDEDTVITLSASPASGYQVKAWNGTDDDTSKDNTNTIKMNANRTITVEFQVIYTIGGDWTVAGELQGIACPGGIVLQLNGDLTVTEGNDSTFIVLLEETIPISLKGTRSGNVLSIDTLIIGAYEYTDLVTGSLTLVSDHEFNGTITVKISDVCSDVYQVTGTR